uniref:Uncharacterized protein n=1 Tax=Lotus japonicus TaxID=34305 RepID=I3SWU8_LOTJA|nr:unknown [Lotus japonicus]
MIREVKEGTSENIETFTTRTSISEEETPDLARSLAMVSWKNSSISSTPSFNVGLDSRPSRKFLGA